jgi:hypothetical protein
MMQSVQVIIERLKTNPEDFFGDLGDTRLRHLNPKFSTIREKLDDLLIEKPDVGHIHRLWYLEPEEKEALLAAYKQARRERFEAKVFHTLLTTPNETPEEYPTATVRKHPTTDKMLMQGWQGQVPGNLIAPQNLINESLAILNKEFDKEYAKNRNT